MDNGKTGTLIKKLRKEKGMTQKELADQLHITDRAVSKWERGLCAPDVSLLEPLAAALGVTVVELISGEQAAEEDTAVKELIDYSQRQITQKTRAFAKKMMAAAAALCLLLAVLIPTANGLVGGDGFAWRCIPAYLCAQRAARAIQTGDAEAIGASIGNSEGMSAALEALRAQGVTIWKAEANFWQTRLDDMFLRLEVELVVLYEDLKYQFTCQGTYREGKVELMGLVSPRVGQSYPHWVLQLSDALATYDPG